MTNYSSIKQLVIDETISNGGLPTFERLTELVKENFPMLFGVFPSVKTFRSLTGVYNYYCPVNSIFY